MYGATASNTGSRRSNASRGGKRRRRRSTRKKNPTPLQWALMATGVAVVGGASYAYYRHRKKKKALELPGGGGGQLPGGGGGGGSKPSTGGGGKSGSKQDAPAFPYSTSEAQAVEQAWAVSATAAAVDPNTGTLTKNADQITDDAFYEIYKIRKIPAKANRGSGWQPYIDSWLRIRDIVKQQMATYGGAVS